MRKFTYIFNEMLVLINKHKLYFLAPILITLAVLSLLAYYIGYSVVMTFIYAGV